MSPEVVDTTLRYLAPSAYSMEKGVGRLELATSGGPAPHPWLAEGFVASPQSVPRALLLLADVAAKRFWMPPNIVAAAIAASDPVVTASDDAIRFEALSMCGGVYARLDIDGVGFDGTVHRHGTTNVDVNPPLRMSLARVGAGDPLHLRIGRDSLEVTTVGGRAVERRVALPGRWVRGFAEVATTMAPFEPAFELCGAGLAQFLESLPTRGARAPTWVVPTRSGARLSTRPVSGAVPATGIERLRALRPIAPFLSSVTAFGVRGEGTGSSGWLGQIDGGAITVALSPAPSRGFSGEGTLLHAALSAPGDGPASDVARLERSMMGQLGFDLASAGWFARDLPYDRSALSPPGGRLAGARDLVEAGAVVWAADRSAAQVSSGSRHYGVRKVDGDWRCSCPWFGRHGVDRGPCKHVLAVRLSVTESGR